MAVDEHSGDQINGDKLAVVLTQLGEIQAGVPMERVSLEWLHRDEIHDHLAAFLKVVDHVLRGASQANKTGSLEASIYTSVDEPHAIIEALRRLAERFDIKIEPDGDIQRGSWFRRFKLRINAAEAPKKLADLAAKAERAAELRYIGEVRSTNDEREANAVASLISALDTTDEAVIQLSSLILVKTGGVVVSQVLTEQQIKHLQSNPGLLKDPRAILDALKQGAPVYVPTGQPRPLETASDGYQRPVAREK
ncbi:hypothetical protein ACFYOT_25935 [Saccharothrix saharensis]|uniref:hypothetical protein n=1 Tax=Saccharothrix saharensis TaxID=571190 RepID=UPI003675A119